MPFAEVAREAPYHQHGWQVARRNRARSRPFFCQESRYSCSPLARYVTGSKESVPHYGSGEIINDRCTNPTTRALLRYLKTESRRMIAEREARSERGVPVDFDWIENANADQLEFVHCRLDGSAAIA